MIPSVSRTLRDRLILLLCACALAAFSLARQGFEFGINNNVFHVPIVLGWAELPQFRDDPLIQSLGRFVTPVFPALRLILTEETIATGFLVLHAVTRALTCLALLLLAAAFGLGGLPARTAAASVVVLSAAAYGATRIGYGELFISYATHSELAQAFALLALAALARGRLAQAGALGGLAFLVNAFVGVWLAPLLGAAALARIGRTPRDRDAWRQAWLMGAAYLAGALPILAWSLLTQRAAVDFDFTAYLRDYFRFHFFVDWTNPNYVARSFVVPFAAALAIPALPPTGRKPATFVLAGMALVWISGAVLGEVTTSRFILLLHLVRSDALLTFIGLSILGVACVRAVQGGRVLALAAGCVMVFALARTHWVFWPTLAAAATLSVAAYLPDRRFLSVAGLAGHLGGISHRWTRIAPAVVFAGALVVSHIEGWYDHTAPRALRQGDHATDRHLEGARPMVPDWAEVQRWARLETPPNAMFLIPLHLGDFRLGARRQPWVDWKQGASAMWAPETHAGWRARHDAVDALRSVPDLLTYARDNGVDYVVLEKRRYAPGDLAAAHGRAVFDNGLFLVLQAARNAGG